MTAWEMAMQGIKICSTTSILYITCAPKIFLHYSRDARSPVLSNTHSALEVQQWHLKVDERVRRQRHIDRIRRSYAER